MTLRQTLSNPRFIAVLFILQFIPLILFPASSFSTSSQEWWLPVVLAVLSLVAVVNILVRHILAPWPWYLMAFSQGFNIISRLMMIMPHSTLNVEGTQVFNWPYVILTLLAMLLSAFFLWYFELPEVRINSMRAQPSH